MVAILLVFITLITYVAFKKARKVQEEKSKVREELIRAKIKAENFKKKMRSTRGIK